MIIEDIITLLKNDSTISSMVGKRIEMFSTKNFKQNSIVFNFTPVSDNKIIRTDKLEIHIIAKTPEDMIAIHERVKHILLTLADEKLNQNTLQIVINGGGTLEDLETNTFHQITYYNLINRSVN